MTYNKTILNNGVRIITEEIEHLKSVSLGIWVNTGSRDETDQENGVSHFIEHMSFKGTPTRSSLDIARDLDAIGGLSNAFTGKENTCFYGRVLGKHFPILAEVLSDIFLNPLFDPINMEREREVIFQEINMMEDSPDDNLNELFNSRFWFDHPMGRSILGTGETVSTINQKTISNYIRNYYIPERIMVVAAGKVDHETMVSHFGPVFDSALKGGSPNPERSVPAPKGGVSLHFKELEQVHICLGGEAPSQIDHGRFACAIFNTILGGNMSSRLFQEVRENRGLAYSIYSFLSSYADTGLLGVYAATEMKNIKLLLETVQQEIRKMCGGDFTQNDLAAAREHLIGGIYLSSESADTRMMRLAKNESIFGREVSYEELVDSLEKVVLDDVVEIAGGVFRNQDLTFASLGPLEDENLVRECLNMG